MWQGDFSSSSFLALAIAVYLRKTSLGGNDYRGVGCHLIALQAPAPEVIAMALSEQCGFQSGGGN